MRCDLLCRAHGVPSLTLQHSTFSIGRDIPFPAHLAFAADCMAVYGDEDARYYAEMGLDPRRLVVTGAPAFDHLATARAGGGGMAGKGVTIFGQGQTWVGPRSTLGHAPDAWCEELARLYRVLCRHFPDAPLRVKPHPAEAAHGIAALYERAVPADLAGRVQVLANADDNNAPALRLLLDQLAGPVRLLTLNREFDARAFAGRVRVTRLGRDELERGLAPVLQDLRAELERDGGTLAYAPGVPIAGGDPAADMELFADAVRERWWNARGPRLPSAGSRVFTRPAC